MPLKINFYFLHTQITESSLKYLLALEAFDNYRSSVSQLQFHQRKFSFSHHKAFGMTEEKFQELMDSYKVSKYKRYRSKALSISVLYWEEGGRTKTIFLFTAPKERKYDVFVAKVSSWIGINRRR